MNNDEKLTFETKEDLFSFIKELKSKNDELEQAVKNLTQSDNGDGSNGSGENSDSSDSEDQNDDVEVNELEKFLQ